MDQNRRPPAYLEYAAAMLASRQYRLMSLTERITVWNVGSVRDALAAGYKLIYPTEWSKHFDEKRHRQHLENASKSHRKGSQTHLNSELMVEQG